MNFRLNSFFWIFAGVLAVEHVIALSNGMHDEAFMVSSSLMLAITLWLLIVPTEWLVRDNKKHLTNAFRRVTATRVVDHQHHWRHWYDTDGYYADQPNINIPSRVYYCIKCPEVHRAVDRIPRYRGGTS